MEERIVSLETEVVRIRELLDCIEQRIESRLERLSARIGDVESRIGDVEYHGLGDVKNDIYSLARKVDGMEREISSIQSSIRYH